MRVQSARSVEMIDDFDLRGMRSDRLVPSICEVSHSEFLSLFYFNQRAGCLTVDEDCLSRVAIRIDPTFGDFELVVLGRKG